VKPNEYRALRSRVIAGMAAVLWSIAAVAQSGVETPMSERAVSERASSLLKQMTLDEKIGQLSQLFVLESPQPVEEAVRKGQVGSLLFVTDPAVINRLQHLAVDGSRLHIPLIFGFDVIHGFRTIFPVPIAMAASWDPSVAMRAQAIAAQEAGSVGINWAFAPMVDIARDPRWGRIVEGAGEDPYLGSAMAAAQVRGFQGDLLGTPGHILACMKHFAGYGAAEGGRDYDASYLSEAQLRNVYLPPFHAAVEAGVGSAMSAYMDLNDVPATGNRWLLQDVLRKDWKFTGLIVSDADAVKSLKVHGYAKDLSEAATRALNAGVDMEMALDFTAYSKNLASALKAGVVTTEQIEAADRRILETKIRLGLFEHPYVDEARSRTVLGAPEHRTEARAAAERSAVLLRNQGGLLPLKAGAYRKIAVIGPLADSQRDTLGPWAFQFDLPETVSVFKGLQDKLGGKVEIGVAPGVQISRKFASFFDRIFHLKPEPAWTQEQAEQERNRAIALARSSDLAVMVLGEAQNMSGEGASRQSLDLPGDQQRLLESVATLGRPVVLVLVNGRPLNITWASQHVPAILEAWYPGTQGGSAVANLLTGDAVPGGKLPISWPRNVGQVPINYAHNTTQAPENQGKRYWEEESTPLYPFGFGLSYSTFTFSNLKLNRSEIRAGESIDVTGDIENTGATTADEVAQLYIHQQSGSASRPVRELKGFQRITLRPGAKRSVHFTLGTNELTYWSAATKAWAEEPSEFDVWLGASSDAQLHSKFKIQE
jgi:beta-glucosidase